MDWLEDIWTQIVDFFTNLYEQIAGWFEDLFS